MLKVTSLWKTQPWGKVDKKNDEGKDLPFPFVISVKEVSVKNSEYFSLNASYSSSHSARKEKFFILSFELLKKEKTNCIYCIIKNLLLDSRNITLAPCVVLVKSTCYILKFNAYPLHLLTVHKKYWNNYLGCRYLLRQIIMISGDDNGDDANDGKY